MQLTGSDCADARTGGLFFSGKPVIRSAMERADHVLQDSPEQRLKMPVCMDVSDEEDEEMEVYSNKQKKWKLIAMFNRL